MIIYKKSTKHIVQARNDISNNPLNSQSWFNIYLRDNKITEEQARDLAYTETTPIELNFILGKHLWNESTQQVEDDLSYVPPPLPEPPTQSNQ